MADYFQRPIDIPKQDEAKNAPGLRRNKMLECCYYCIWTRTDFYKWYCGKHDIIFGNAGTTNQTAADAIGMMVEFVCDDLER